MRVENILQSKKSNSVVTLPRGTSVSEAAQLLSERRIGAVVISKSGKSAEGILSERDIVREIGNRGAGCLADIVDDLMTEKVKTCTREHTTDSVLNIMTEGRFRHMPVVEDGELIGLISLGDVVKARLEEVSAEKDAMADMIMGR